MLESEELIIKFHEFIKGKYPDITHEEVNTICRAPFIFLRKQMAKVNLPEIRFKYWGVFRVKEGRKVAIDNMIDANLKKGRSVDKLIEMKQINLNSNKNDEQSES